MIIDEIKNSVKEALYKMDNNINFHYEEASHTGFPYAIFSLKKFMVQHYATHDKQKLNLSFEIVYQKSKDNRLSELLAVQKNMANVLLPIIKVLGKKLSLDEVKFETAGKQLIMNFDLNFYTYEEDDEYELMQILDLTMKEDKNA